MGKVFYCNHYNHHHHHMEVPERLPSKIKTKHASTDLVMIDYSNEKQEEPPSSCFFFFGKNVKISPSSLQHEHVKRELDRETKKMQRCLGISVVPIMDSSFTLCQRMPYSEQDYTKSRKAVCLQCQATFLEPFPKKQF